MLARRVILIDHVFTDWKKSNNNIAWLIQCYVNTPWPEITGYLWTYDPEKWLQDAIIIIINAST